MLQLVDVLGESFPTLFATGLPCGGAVSVASDGGRLHVVHGMPSESYMYTSTLNGTTFTTQTPLPIDQGFVGRSAFTTYADGLALLWAENAGGRTHFLNSDDGGSSWGEVELPIKVVPDSQPSRSATSGSRASSVGRGAHQAPWMAVMREAKERVKLDLVFVEKLLTFMIRGSLRGPAGRIRRAHGVPPAPVSASVA